MIRGAGLAALALALAGNAAAQEPLPSCATELVVLDASETSAIAVLDRAAGARYLFDQIVPADDQAGLDGVFLTHAHDGRPLGLDGFARGAAGVPVFVMPRMAQFLTANASWSELVEQGSVAFVPLEDNVLMPASDTFGVWPIAVPQRGDGAETVGFLIMTPGKRALYLPDLAGWGDMEAVDNQALSDLLDMVDIALVDARVATKSTLDGRYMLAAVHSRGEVEVRFIHYDLADPLHDPASPESARAAANGFGVARAGDRMCLD